MPSIIGSYYTLSKCLDQLQTPYDKWESVNVEQQTFLDIYKYTSGADIPEIESKMSTEVKVVNDFLASHGFSIRLQETQDGIYLASILDLMLKWIKASKDSLYCYKNSERYDAVYIEDHVTVYDIDDFVSGVAVIRTDNGDLVYVTKLLESPKDSFDTFNLATKLLANFNDTNKCHPSERYEQDNVKFPMIHHDSMVDISWLVDMQSKLNGFKISEALQQTKVDIDEVGVKVKEAVAMSARCCSCSFSEPIPLVINEPFLFVIEREGLKKPLFSAYFDIESWNIKK